jgi:defect-in-organelle-trafficking protein DotB
MSIQAETGIAVYSTVHTNSVEETLSRILREFPQSERDSMAASLISSIRLVVHQRLVPSIKGGRVALRSYLEFTESIRRQLLNLEMHELTGAIREMVMSEGKTLLDDARQKLEDGLINEEYYHKFAAILKSETGE